MIPLAVLVSVTVVARAVGAAGAEPLNTWIEAVRLGLAVMLALTASAHFASRRADLIKMVPPSLPRPDLLVTLTGLAEAAIAVALLFDATARVAAAVLIVLLVVMFPANVHAAKANIPLGGRPPTPLGLRALIQLIFLCAAAAVAV